MTRVLPQPFDDFLKSVASVAYEEIASLPGSEVESAPALEEMRTYLLDLYSGVKVKASYVEDDGQVIDCIPTEQHPARKRLSTDDIASAAPDAPPSPEVYDKAPPPFVSEPTRDLSDALPRLQSQERSQGGFPSHTLPLYRTTLQQLARFKNLAAFSAKDQRLDAAAAGGPAAATGKRYATGEQDLDCLGGSSTVNVWRVFVTPTLQSTFSQQWYVAGHDGTVMQTVECGWHIDYSRYGDAEPHLFIYTTRQNYDPNQSFYNLDGGIFTPVANPTVLPGTRLLTSQWDGTQIEYQMGFYLTAGAWRFYFQGIPVGYYPLTWFNNGPLTSGAKRIKFGGEVGTAFPSWPPMGSGSLPSAGFGRAAYQRAALAYPTSGGAVSPNLAEAGSTSGGTCYTIDIQNNSGSAWGTYLFFGGPGGQPC